MIQDLKHVKHMRCMFDILTFAGTQKPHAGNRSIVSTDMKKNKNGLQCRQCYAGEGQEAHREAQLHSRARRGQSGGSSQDPGLLCEVSRGSEGPSLLAEKRRCSQRMDCGMRPCRSSPVSWI